MRLNTFIKIVKSVRFLYTNIVPFSIQDFIEKSFNNETYLSQVEFHLVDHCNLNCAYCDHFTPLAPKHFVNIDEIINDFKKLKKIFSHIGKIFILGGEPLLHPNLLEIFEPLKNIYPKSEIVIVTNGVLLNKMNENFWSALKSNQISLSMTKYPIKVDYEGYIEKCKELGIKSYLFSAERFSMQKMNLNIKGKSNKTKAFNRCWRKNCHFLRNSKLYVCPLVSNIKYLNDYFNLNFQIENKDYIDINKIKSPSKIKKLFTQPIPFCKYCSDKETPFANYNISKKEISEWIANFT